MTEQAPAGPPDARRSPASPAPTPSPGCPPSTPWAAPTSPSSACRSTPASPTGRAPGSGRRTPRRAQAAAALPPVPRRRAVGRSTRSRTPATSPSTPSTCPAAIGRCRRRRAPCSSGPTSWCASAATTRSRCRCCGPRRPGTARSRSCTSTRTSTPGTPTSARPTPTARRSAAPSEEGLLDLGTSPTSASAGRCTPRGDLAEDGSWGSPPSPAIDVARRAPTPPSTRVLERVGDRPVYVSVDIDVLDPAHAPGTGTPEAGGLTTPRAADDPARSRGANLVGGDVVEVRPGVRPRRADDDRGGQRRVRAARPAGTRCRPLTSRRGWRAAR